MRGEAVTWFRGAMATNSFAWSEKRTQSLGGIHRERLL